jgi:hypothetical protein
MQKELDVIIDLMKDLQDKMQYGEDDFAERLGRKKPEGLEVAKVSVMPGEDDDKDMAMEPDGDADDMAMMGHGGDEDCFEDEEKDPEADFKKRLMKLRG